MPSIIKETVALASGFEANIAIVHIDHFSVDPFNWVPPSEMVLRTEAALATGRLGAETYPVLHPSVRVARPVTYAGFENQIEIWSERVSTIARHYQDAGISLAKLWHDRRGTTPSAYPVPLAHTDLMRLRSATLAKTQIFANGNYFLFEPRELDTPFEAYGDPVGMVASVGTILNPPQLPRACLVSDGSTSTIRHLSFADINIMLPGALTIDAHQRGTLDAEQTASTPIAIARYYGSTGGRTDRGKNVVEVAIVGRHAVAMSKGGDMPIPRSGCVIRFPNEPEKSIIAALRSGEPVSYSLTTGRLVDGVQAGPQLVTNGVIENGDAIFHQEGFFVEDEQGDLIQPSPFNWKADWHHTRAARLGAGFDAAGRLFFLGVEGQSSYTKSGGPLRGATLHDLAELLVRYGAVDAMHLDGGGSTQLFRPFGGSILRPGNFCRGFEDVEADYDRPLPLGLRLELANMDVRG
ncbi:phosphodiester glycosidase family protein [Rhizobium terrae]|uniref:phosphodiester glycosidase family protein n=1 Tax=Rhizobium terrae TaxID=2171756 RepID=UPI0013C36D33|nr:phosphodiester glycosidase family protein [Rhizobium terrae]